MSTTTFLETVEAALRKIERHPEYERWAADGSAVVTAANRLKAAVYRRRAGDLEGEVFPLGAIDTVSGEGTLYLPREPAIKPGKKRE